MILHQQILSKYDVPSSTWEDFNCQHNMKIKKKKSLTSKMTPKAVHDQVI